jgi:hypothetical protein
LTLEVKTTDFLLTRIQNRHHLAETLDPFLAGINITHLYSSTPTAQRLQFLKHDLAKVTATAAVNDEFAHGIRPLSTQWIVGHDTLPGYTHLAGTAVLGTDAFTQPQNRDCGRQTQGTTGSAPKVGRGRRRNRLAQPGAENEARHWQQVGDNRESQQFSLRYRNGHPVTDTALLAGWTLDLNDRGAQPAEQTGQGKGTTPPTVATGRATHGKFGPNPNQLAIVSRNAAPPDNHLFELMSLNNRRGLYRSAALAEMQMRAKPAGSQSLDSPGTDRTDSEII